MTHFMKWFGGVFPAVALLVFSFAISAKASAMELRSGAFEDREKIPAQYAMPEAGGKNASIPLSWSGPPPNTKSFALTIIDPHPVAKNWIHWMVINIPSRAVSLDVNASGRNMPPGALELKNSFGSSGYGGPQPPKGSGDHPYVITLYALKAEALDPKTIDSLEAFQQAIKGKVLGKASITGYFGK